MTAPVRSFAVLFPGTFFHSFHIYTLETSNHGKELSSMNPNTNQRCGCFCRPQIPAPPCMNTDCRCEHCYQCDPCDDRFLPTPAQIPLAPQPRTPMPQTQPPTPPVRPANQARQQCPPMASSAAMKPSASSAQQNPTAASVPTVEAQVSSPATSGSCGCGNPLIPNTSPEQMPIGMAYVPWQRWNHTYSVEQGFARGTIFPELDLPFVMGRCR